MHRSLGSAVLVAGVVAAALSPVACTTREPEASTYFDRVISPILTTSCVRTNTGAGCHVSDAKGNAFGNLDTSTFEGVDKRRDLFLDYGPYGQPGFLAKNVEPFQADVQLWDGTRVTVTTDIKHAGGSILDPTGTAYQTLRRWIQNGATENNAGRPPTNVRRQPCNTVVPARPGFDPGVDPPRADFALFRDKVNGVLRDGCAAGNCHGTPANALYVTCGDTPEQVRWNYLAAEEYLAKVPEQSELVRKPLSASQGGAYHGGGVVYESSNDEGYRTISEWATAHGPLEVTAESRGFEFFARKVQPVLVKKGCMFVQCHSSAAFHDYRLKGGSGGAFSLSATRKNYELSRLEVSLEDEDPRASRLVRKNLYRPDACTGAGCRDAVGILHRGGPLLEDFGADVATWAKCVERKYDYDKGNLDEIPAFCVLGEWLRREREEHPVKPFDAVVYVRRPLGGLGRVQEFEAYQPGADLRRATVTASSGTYQVGADTSLTAGCGLDPATADIRRPQVSWDGVKVAFAARASASAPLEIYEMNADGSSCAKHPLNATAKRDGNGLLIHNFDPAYSPPDVGGPHLVFASTRGNLDDAPYGYSGPQRTPADPSKANANLYVWEPDPGAKGKHRVRQLTFLLNMEREPSFMLDGRVILTAEKRAPEFYQLALRRINLDGGDYHPLYAQRASIGFPEATSTVELADRNFAAIFRVPGTPHGGGTLGVFNRSIGIDFRSTDPNDYPIDKAVIDPAAPQSPDPAFFLRSLAFPDRSVSARPGTKTSGLFATPATLPNGSVLASFGAAASVDAFSGDYDLYVVSPATGAKYKLLGEPGVAEVDAVAVYGKVSRGIFRSSLDEPNAHVIMVPGKKEAEVTIHDVPLMASLLFQNTPTGRTLETDVREVFLYEDMPPPLDVTRADAAGAFAYKDAFGSMVVRRRLLGRAPVYDDGSTKIVVPGGLPLLLRLPETQLSRERGLPRVQRENIVYSPGEYAHQSFKASLFDSLCANCHGSVSGRPIDAAVRPDVLTSASDTIARGSAPAVMVSPPEGRGPIEGPPPAP